MEVMDIINDVFTVIFLAAMLAFRISFPGPDDGVFYVVFVLACGATIANKVEERGQAAAWVRHRMKMRVR